jgi:hypothetical protein
MSFVNSMKLAKIKQLAYFTIWPNPASINPNQKLFVNLTASATSQAVHLNMKRPLKTPIKVSALINQIHLKSIPDLQWESNKKYAGSILDVFAKAVILSIPKDKPKIHRTTL